MAARHDIEDCLWGFIRLAVFMLGCLAIGNCTNSKTGFAPPLPVTGNAAIPVQLPANAPSISQHYREYTESPGGGARRLENHLAIDVIAELGAPVIAAASEQVVRSFSNPVYGNQIIIVHTTDNSGLGMRTWYKHLQNRLVQQGDLVVCGQPIGGLEKSGYCRAIYCICILKCSANPEENLLPL